MENGPDAIPKAIIVNTNLTPFLLPRAKNHLNQPTTQEGPIKLGGV